MKTWRIPVIRQVRGIIEFEADSLSDAINTVKDRCDHGSYTDNYVKKPRLDELAETPWEVEWDGTMSEMDWIRQEYNDDNRDEPPELKLLVRGRWIGEREKDTFGYLYHLKCSRCDRRNSNRTPYCPHCGAKMDLEREATDE